MHILVLAIGFGIVSGAILCVSAMGFSLQFGMTNVLNLSYGTILSLGGLIAYLFAANGLSYWVGGAVGTLVAGAASLLLGSTLIRGFARRGARVLEMAMVTLGLALVVEYGMASVTHSAIYQFQFPAGSRHTIAGMTFTTTQLLVILVAVLIVLVVEVLLHWTRLGRALRATSQNPTLARASGIRTSRVINLTWFVTGLLGGLGGVLLAFSYQTVSFFMGTDYLPYILAVVILGGIGSVGMAAVTSLVLGLVTQIAGAYGASSYNVVIALGIVLVVLVARPGGLVGSLYAKQEVVV